jgi:hypothetical protein
MKKKILKNQYPKVFHKRKMVLYDPDKHQLEQGESVCFLDIDTGKVGKGFVKKVQISNPMKYPMYIIGKKTFMYHRVWPNVEDSKKTKADRKIALSKLTRKDRKILGV